MRRHKLNLAVDVAFFVLFIVLALTGILLEFVLPPGGGQGRNLVWGLTRHEWGDVHFWVAVAAAGALLVHLALHWAWVWASSFQALGAQSRIGRWGPRVRLFGGLAILALMAGGTALFWRAAAGQVQQADAGGRGHRGGRGAGRQVEVLAEPADAASEFRQKSPDGENVTPADPSVPRRWRGGRPVDAEQPPEHSERRQGRRNAGSVDR